MPLEPGEAAFAYALTASNDTRQLKLEIDALKVRVNELEEMVKALIKEPR